VLAALPASGLEKTAVNGLGRVVALALTAAIGWTLTRMVAAVFDVYIDRARALGGTDFHARRRRTQLIVFRRVAVAAGLLLTAGLVMTAIPTVRTVGLSLFASAGVAGIVAGLAARPAVSNLIAGLQLAVTQPIRIGDAVVVEGQWGVVEEIGSAYVTIVTWDQRSLVVPISWFTERPVWNWTRSSSQLLDTVFLYVDYAVPVAAIRRKVAEVLAGTPLWDGRVQAVQVTGLKENAVEVRVLMSAADAGRMFDLRCLMREELVGWLTREYPDGLPRLRVTGPHGDQRLASALTPRRGAQEAA
jgi:small-conductance mechanosensitive channel